MKKLLPSFSKRPKNTTPFLKTNYNGSGSVRPLPFDFIYTWGNLIILSLKI